MACGFELARKGDNELWVSTPKPVTNLLWAALVYHTSPELNLRDPNYEGNPSRDDDKMILREEEQGRSLLTDGHHGKWTTHLILPDQGMDLVVPERTGLIYAPDWALPYLEFMEKSVPTANSADFLERVVKSYKDTIGGLIERTEEYLSHRNNAIDPCRSRGYTFACSGAVYHILHETKSCGIQPYMWHLWTRDRVSETEFAKQQFKAELQQAIDETAGNSDRKNRGDAINERLKTTYAPLLSAA